MLSGIKRGKRKRKVNNDESDLKRKHASPSRERGEERRKAADDLYRMLQSEGSETAIATATANQPSEENPSSKRIQNVFERLEQKGRITTLSESNSPGGNVVLMNGASQAVLQTEDLRHGSRKGKLKQTGLLHSGIDKSIADMVNEEKQDQQSMDEIFARNVARLGSRYKGAEFSRSDGAGADEEDMCGDGGLGDMNIFTSQSDRLTDTARIAREKSRNIAIANKQQAVTNKCSYWMESGSFQKHMLLSLGDHLSLVLIPSHQHLVEYQCALVPIKYAESFASCDDEVFDELKRFQTSLRKMFHKDGKGVIFLETVLSTNGFWQAKMDCVPVPLSVEQDAPMYFKSALTEVVMEWGTHTKTMSIKKGLRNTVPNGFPYFMVEWGDSCGYAQIIESDSFDPNFGLDTIAGVCEIDPVRFNRKKKAKDHDKSKVLSFVHEWKPFDWTLELDG